MGIVAVLFLAIAMVPLYQLWQEHNAKKSSDSQQINTKPGPQLQGTKLAGFEPVASVPALQAIDTQPGSGDTVKPGDTVTVDYTGALAASGVIFESSKDTGQPATLSLREVIAGWSQGIPGMKVGGTRRLLIPGNLAYPQGKGSIPPNADLVFDISLRKIDR